jgi:predicted O-linked N-acetylglucosamine transferase (SPINDLY family)
MDYRIVDSLTDPAPHADALCTERLIRIDPCFLCYRVPTDAPDPGPPPSITAGHITFGSFNDLKKLSGATIEMWAAVLARVPNSRLVLKNFGLTHERTRADVIGRFASCGIDPSRVDPLPPVSATGDHLGLYQRIDIALDTFPYHGTTTTCEALAMGVPVVTHAGDRHASRVGVSLLTNVGLAECIAATPEEYVRIAGDLAAESARLAAWRSSLRARLIASPLCDAPTFAARFCDALRDMWRTYIAAQPVKGSKR